MNVAVHVALAVFAAGTLWRIGWYVWLCMKYPGSTKRAQTPSKPTRRSVLTAACITNVWPYSRFWCKTNPLTFTGHVLYHAGLFTGLGTYGLVMIISHRQICQMQLTDSIIFVADWFQHKEIVFGNSGWQMFFGNVMYWVFAFALAIAVIGIAIPYIASFLGQRGIINPPDDPTNRAGISSIRPPLLKPQLRLERKAIGLIALIMDAAMLSTFVFPAMVQAATVIHVAFGLTILASIPYGFLRHEVFRFGMAHAVIRHARGY